MTTNQERYVTDIIHGEGSSVYNVIDRWNDVIVQSYRATDGDGRAHELSRNVTDSLNRQYGGPTQLANYWGQDPTANQYQ